MVQSNSGAYNDDGTRTLAGPVPQEMDNPDQFIKDQVNAEISRMQGVFEQQWKMIENQKKYIGEERVMSTLNQLAMAAKQKVMMLKADGQAKIDQMNGIRQLQDRGFLNKASDMNPGGSVDKMLWSVAAGDRVAEGMFPREKAPEPPEPPVDPAEEFDAFKRHADKVRDQSDQFRVVPAKRNAHWYLPKGMESVTPAHVQKLNRQTAVRDKDGNLITGQWEKAETEDIRKLGNLMTEGKVMEEAMDLSARGLPVGVAGVGKLRKIAHSYITGQNTAGTFGMKVAASVLSRKLDKGQVQTTSGNKRIRVKHLASGQPGTILESEFNEQEYERLQ